MKTIQPGIDNFVNVSNKENGRRVMAWKQP